MVDDKKTNSKYKYINRINDILNDETECEEARQDALRIKNKRLKEALAKAKSSRSSYN